jgi:hypothetical protein
VRVLSHFRSGHPAITWRAGQQPVDAVRESGDRLVGPADRGEVTIPIVVLEEIVV